MRSFGNFLEWACHPKTGRPPKSRFYLRQKLEGLPACVLHDAKPVDYNPEYRFSRQHPRQTHPESPPCNTPPPLPAPPFATAPGRQHRPAAIAAPSAALAKRTSDKPATTNAPTKKKGVNKVTYQRSSSEETTAATVHAYRECKGMHNAGACRGYTRK